MEMTSQAMEMEIMVKTMEMAIAGSSSFLPVTVQLQ